MEQGEQNVRTSTKSIQVSHIPTGGRIQLTRPSMSRWLSSFCPDTPVCGVKTPLCVLDCSLYGTFLVWLLLKYFTTYVTIYPQSSTTLVQDQGQLGVGYDQACTVPYWQWIGLPSWPLLDQSLHRSQRRLLLHSGTPGRHQCACNRRLWPLSQPRRSFLVLTAKIGRYKKERNVDKY